MIEIYTDGAFKKSLRQGGYGIIMIFKQKKYIKEFSAGFQNTTNNRMELIAVIEALKKIKIFSYPVFLYSDSKYVINAINKNWLLKWQKNNFIKIKNSDLWLQLIYLLPKFKIKFIWIKGHSHNIFNKRADQLAVKACIQKQYKLDIQL